MNKETYQRLDRIFAGMKRRCYCPNNNKYKLYGARGITICDEWLQNKDIFIDWAIKNGYNNNLSIDRINADGNYCPENCRWADRKEQNKNKRNNHLITFHNETKTLFEWAKEYNINPFTLLNRINVGWDIEKALNKKVARYKKSKL